MTVGPLLTILPPLVPPRPPQLAPHHGRAHLHLRRDLTHQRTIHRPRGRARPTRLDDPLPLRPLDA